MRFSLIFVLLAFLTCAAHGREYPEDVSACSFGVSTGLCSLRPMGVDHVCNPCDSRSYIQCSSEAASEAHVLYCADGKLFDPLTGSCENADSVRLTCYDVISRPSAASQVAGATHWRITNWFTYQQDKACGFLGWLLAKLLPVASHCSGKHVVLHSSGRSTTLTSTLHGQPAVVTTTTISSTSYEPQPLLQHPDSTGAVPHFLDPDSLPSGQSVPSASLAAYLRGKQQQRQQQQPPLVLHPDLTSDLSQGSRGEPVPNSILQQVIPRLGISSEAIAEVLQDRPTAAVAAADPADPATASAASAALESLAVATPATATDLVVPEPAQLSEPTSGSAPDAAGTEDQLSDMAAAALQGQPVSEERAGEYSAQDMPTSEEAVESAVAEDAGADNAEVPRGMSHPFDSSDVVVPT